MTGFKSFVLPRNGGFPARAWLMASTSFSPYEAEMWEWEVSGGAHTADGLTTFFASPLWDDHSLPCMISHKRLALELSSLPDRHQRKWSVVAYEATCLSVLLFDVSFFNWRETSAKTAPFCSKGTFVPPNSLQNSLGNVATKKRERESKLMFESRELYMSVCPRVSCLPHLFFPYF